MVDRRNRVRWALVGLVLLAAGVAGALIAYDLVPWVDSDTPLLPDTVVQRWERAENWRLPVLAVAGLLLALYGWRVLAAQLRRGGGRTTVGDLELGGPPGDDRRPAGWTLVRGPALAHGVEDDLERVNGVQRALVGLFGSPQQPDLRAELDSSGAADLRRVREQVDRALDRLTDTTGHPPRSTTITFRLADGQVQRVR